MEQASRDPLRGISRSRCPRVLLRHMLLLHLVPATYLVPGTLVPGPKLQISCQVPKQRASSKLMLMPRVESTAASFLSSLPSPPPPKIPLDLCFLPSYDELGERGHCRTKERARSERQERVMLATTKRPFGIRAQEGEGEEERALLQVEQKLPLFYAVENLTAILTVSAALFFFPQATMGR